MPPRIPKNPRTKKSVKNFNLLRRPLLLSPAGPAWEGATIAWGMRAAHGAIERAQIVDGDLEVRTIGGGPPLGICGSGLLDLVSEFVRAGLIDSSGRILGIHELGGGFPAALKRRIVAGANGVNHLRVAQLENTEYILLTQKDIREVQLAKSAIASGVTILMKELGITSKQIDKVLIAGAFGNHIRGEDAVDSGLIPALDPARIFGKLERMDITVKGVDISDGGLGIQTDIPLSPGFVWFWGTIGTHKGGMIVWSRKEDSGYRAGIQFLPIPMSPRDYLQVTDD